MELNKYLDYLVTWLQDEVKTANCNGVIVGVSGGIDSALVSALAKKAFPKEHLTVWMPLESSELDLECKNQLVKDLELNNITVDLKNTFDVLKQELNKDVLNSDLALANTKARLRMTTLYSLAQTKKYLVLGTDNLDEWHIGYFTKFGDGGCDLAPIIHLLKGEVKEASKLMGVPEIIINRAPTASLWEDQTDEKEIGFSYEVIDKYLSGQVVPNEVKERVDFLHKISEHKRNGLRMPKENNDKTFKISWQIK